MPQVPGFLKTLDRLKELHKSKNDDYAKDSNPFYNFDTTLFILSQFTKDEDKTYVWPIANKLSRLANLLSNDKQPNNESILDSLDDIIVYTTLWRQDIETRRLNINKKQK